jgi:hypothetical protein
MSPASTTGHHHARWLRLRHSVTRSGETSSLRLARPTADEGNGITQHTPLVLEPTDPGLVDSEASLCTGLEIDRRPGGER